MPERVRKVPNSVRPKVRMMSVRFQSLQHAPPLLDHHRVQERGAGEPRHEGGVLDRIPRPVAAPAEHVIAPPAADQEPERQEIPGDDGPAPRDGDPLVADAARDERGDGEGEGHREAGEAEVERHGVRDHPRVLEQRVEPAAVGGDRGEALEGRRRHRHHEQEEREHAEHHREHPRVELGLAFARWRQRPRSACRARASTPTG